MAGEQWVPGALDRRTPDWAVDILRDGYRRDVLLALSEGWVDEEADVVRRGTDEEEVRSDLRETHLPMLEEAGIIEWDRETGEISTGPNFDEIESLLEQMEEHADGVPPSWL